jgi:hypothetical protein
MRASMRAIGNDKTTNVHGAMASTSAAHSLSGAARASRSARAKPIARGLARALAQHLRHIQIQSFRRAERGDQRTQRPEPGTLLEPTQCFERFGTGVNLETHPAQGALQRAGHRPLGANRQRCRQTAACFHCERGQIEVNRKFVEYFAFRSPTRGEQELR